MPELDSSRFFPTPAPDQAPVGLDTSRFGIDSIGPEVQGPPGPVSARARANMAGDMGAAQQAAPTSGPGIVGGLRQTARAIDEYSPGNIIKRAWAPYGQAIQHMDEGAVPAVQQLAQETVRPIVETSGPTMGGAAKGLAAGAGGIVSPTNVGIGTLIAAAPGALARLASAGFSVDMLSSAVQNDPELRDAWDRKDIPKLLEVGIPKLMMLGMGTGAAIHAVGRGPAGPVPRPRGGLEDLAERPVEAPAPATEAVPQAPVVEAKAAPAPPEVDLSPEALQAAFRLPDGSIQITGANHVGPKVPGAERGFVDRAGRWVPLDELEKRIVAGRGQGEATIGPEEAAPPTEAVKQQGQDEFGIDFDSLTRQAEEARNAARLQRPEADNRGEVSGLAPAEAGERGNRPDQGDRNLPEQERPSDAVGGGRRATGDLGAAGEGPPELDAKLFALEREAIAGEPPPIEEGGATAEEIAKADAELLRSAGARPLTAEQKAERAGRPGKTLNWAKEGVDQAEKPEAFFRPEGVRTVNKAEAARIERQIQKKAREIREIQSALDAGVAVPPEVIAQYPGLLRLPKPEFSPEASEAQRAIEERDMAAGKKASPEPKAVQGTLGLSEDYGRKGDQQEIGFDPEMQKRLDAEEAAFEARRAEAKPAEIVNSDVKPEKSFAERTQELDKAIEAGNPLADKMGLRIKHGTPGGGAEPERNWTNKIIIENDALKQTKRAAPESAESWRAVPVAAKKAGHVMTDAVQKVNEAYGSQDGWDIHKKVVHASQLEGKAGDYANLAASIMDMTPDKVLDLYGNDINAVVDVIGSKSRFKPGRVNEMRVTADKLFRKGDGTALRDHLVDVFSRASEAAQASADAVDLGGRTLQDWVNDPRWQRANRAYKDTLEKFLAEEHAENQGRFLSADSLGPAQTYMPMLAPKESSWGSLLSSFRRPFAPRGNPWNKMRTGLSESYDLGNEALTHAVGRGLRSLATKRALETDRKLGLIQDLKENERTPPAISWDGRTFVRSEPFETTSPKMILREGERPGQIPPKRAITPEWHHQEIRQILAGDRQDWSNPALQGVRDQIVKSALFGAFDMAFHSTNVAATSLSRVPVIGSNLALRVAQQIPGFGLLVKPLALAEHLRKMDPFSDKARGRSGLTGKELFDRLADSGAIPDRYARETYSKEVSKATGAKVVRYNLSAALIGPKGLDIRARMLFLDDLLARNPEATKADIYQYVNNLGNYVYQLNSKHMRAVKKAGLSSFVTAGKAMNTNAIQSLLATGREPTTGSTFVKGKAQLLANSSIIAAAATWVALHKAYRDEEPWKDPDAKLLAIQVKDEDRDSLWAKFLFSKQEREGDTPLYISPTDLLQPFTARGMRAVGMRAFLETLYRGGDKGQALEHGSTEAANTFMHPYTGPVAQAVTRAIGFEPYIQTQHERGRPVISPRSSVQEDTRPGLPTFWARGKSAVWGLNPSARGFEGEPSFGKRRGQEPEPMTIPERALEGARYTAAQVLFPRAARHHTSLPSAEAKRLQKEQDYFARRGLD